MTSQMNALPELREGEHSGRHPETSSICLCALLANC